jgi:hypothetical protein
MLFTLAEVVGGDAGEEQGWKLCSKVDLSATPNRTTKCKEMLNYSILYH